MATSRKDAVMSELVLGTPYVHIRHVQGDGGYQYTARPATPAEIAEALLAHIDDVYRGDTFAHEYATNIAKAMILDFKERATQERNPT